WIAHLASHNARIAVSHVGAIRSTGGFGTSPRSQGASKGFSVRAAFVGPAIRHTLASTLRVHSNRNVFNKLDFPKSVAPLNMPCAASECRTEMRRPSAEVANSIEFSTERGLWSIGCQMIWPRM